MDGNFLLSHLVQKHKGQRRTWVDSAIPGDHGLVCGVQARGPKPVRQRQRLLSQGSQLRCGQVQRRGHMTECKRVGVSNVNRRHLRQPEGLQHRVGPGLEPVGVAGQVGGTVGPHGQVPWVLQPGPLRPLKHLDLRVVEQELQRKEGHRCGTTTTAVGQHALIRAHTQVLQHGLNLAG